MLRLGNNKENQGMSFDTDLPVVVKIKPGTAAEKSMRFILPEEMVGKSITSVVGYALGLKEEDGFNREFTRIQERVGTEMSGKYGLSVNGQAVDGKGQLSSFLIKVHSPSGKEYLEAEIIVAARQEGANLESYL